jgi:hypothetical protein
MFAISKSSNHESRRFHQPKKAPSTPPDFFEYWLLGSKRCKEVWQKRISCWRSGCTDKNSAQPVRVLYENFRINNRNLIPGGS